MSDAVPRIGVVLSRDDARARQGLRALVAALKRAPVDFIIIEAPERLARLSPSKSGDVAPSVAVLREVLARGRASGWCGCVLAPPRVDPHDPLVPAVDLVRSQVIDAVVLLDATPDRPLLRVRGSARVVEPGPAPLAPALRVAERVLRSLGVSRPRFVLLRGEADGERRADEARAVGVTLAGPLPEAAAVLERGDAWVALLRTQAELLRALAGAGPTTTFLLDPELRACVVEDPTDGLLLASERLAAWSREEGELAAARAPAVSVARATAAASGRCPFCRRGLDESPGGEPAAPGPPATCEGCGTAHHRDCLGEHRRCTVLGCESRRATRLGVSLPIAALGAEMPERHPFRALVGDAGHAALDRAPVLLRVEAPIDDSDAAADRRHVALELGAASVRRGELVEGHVAVWSTRPFRVRGGVLRVRTTLTLRDLADPAAAERVDPILGREASFVGERPSGTLGRLQDGVVQLFGGTGGVAIPAGCRRWPFSFRLQPDHPATVSNRRGTVEETVKTVLEVVLDTEVASADLVVG